MSDVACSTTSQGGNPDDFPFVSLKFRTGEVHPLHQSPSPWLEAGLVLSPVFCWNMSRSCSWAARNRRGYKMRVRAIFFELWGQYFIIKFYMSIVNWASHHCQAHMAPSYPVWIFTYVSGDVNSSHGFPGEAALLRRWISRGDECRVGFRAALPELQAMSGEISTSDSLCLEPTIESQWKSCWPNIPCNHRIVFGPIVTRIPRKIFVNRQFLGQAAGIAGCCANVQWCMRWGSQSRKDNYEQTMENLPEILVFGCIW